MKRGVPAIAGTPDSFSWKGYIEMTKKPLKARIANIYKEVGAVRFFCGVLKRCYYMLLCKRYGFDRWHIQPIELRPYALRIVEYINGLKHSHEDCVVEVGCGLGEILRNLQYANKYGFDLSESVLNAAKFLGDREEYLRGTFCDVSAEIKADRIFVLIAVNFIHGIEPSELRSYFMDIINNIDVETIIVDTVDGEGYKYCHNLKEILPEYPEKKLICQYGRRKVFALSRTE